MNHPVLVMPPSIRTSIPLMSTWTHKVKGGRYLVTSYALGMVPDSEYDHEWGIVYESDGVRYFRPVSSFSMSFVRVGGKP